MFTEKLSEKLRDCPDSILVYYSTFYSYCRFCFLILNRELIIETPGLSGQYIDVLQHILQLEKLRDCPGSKIILDSFKKGGITLWGYKMFFGL